MFKTKKIQDKTVYYSDITENIQKFEHFFTSRDIIVKENKNLIANYLKIPEENLIKPEQTHSANIAIAKKGQNYPQTDALILDNSDIAIYLNFADCTPVILYDSKNHIAAIAHAGWRGTAEKIAQKTVLKMKDLYDSNPKDIIAIIGPCISFKHFETYDEALAKLKNSVKNQSGLFRDNYADLKGINKTQLEEIGVEKTDICPYCTIDDNDKFFSYRAENKTKSRHSAIVKLY